MMPYGITRPWRVILPFGLSKVVVTFNYVGESFNLFEYHHQGCLNSPTFSNLGSCAACWAHFMCHHELWPTSLSHPFSSLNSSLGHAGRKHYQKITFPIFRLVLQNFVLPGCFLCILFCCYLLSLLSSGWFVIAVCGSISVRVLINLYDMRTGVELGAAASVPLVCKLYLVHTRTDHRYQLESWNLHQTCIVGYFQLVLKVRVISQTFKVLLAILTQNSRKFSSSTW